MNQNDKEIQRKLCMHYGYVDDVRIFKKDIAKDMKDLKDLDPEDISYGY